MSASTRKLTGCFCVGAFTSASSQKPAGRWTVCASGREGTISPRSFIALSSSRDAVLILFMLLRPAFPCRYKSRPIISLRVGDTVDFSINHTEGDFSDFPVVLPVVDLGRSRPLEDQGRAQKTNAMLRQIGLTLIVISFEFHRSYPLLLGIIYELTQNPTTICIVTGNQIPMILKFLNLFDFLLLCASPGKVEPTSVRIDDCIPLRMPDERFDGTCTD